MLREAMKRHNLLTQDNLDNLPEICPVDLAKILQDNQEDLNIDGGFSMNNIIRCFHNQLDEAQQDAHENARALKRCALEAANRVGQDVVDLLGVQ